MDGWITVSLLVYASEWMDEILFCTCICEWMDGLMSEWMDEILFRTWINRWMSHCFVCIFEWITFSITYVNGWMDSWWMDGWITILYVYANDWMDELLFRTICIYANEWMDWWRMDGWFTVSYMHMRMNGWMNDYFV